MTVYGAADGDHFKARCGAWQAFLEHQVFLVPESNTPPTRSRPSFKGKYHVQRIYYPANWWHVTFKFMDGENELLRVEANREAVF